MATGVARGPATVLSDDGLGLQQTRDQRLTTQFGEQYLSALSKRVVSLAGYTFSTVSYGVAALSFGSLLTGLSPFVAIPSALVTLFAGSVAFFVATNYVNLADPSVLSHVRKEIEMAFRDFRLQHEHGTLHHLREDAAHFLEGIAEKYGWDTMFYYGIPRPALFNEIFAFQAELLPMSEVISLYEKLQLELQVSVDRHRDDVYTYEVPHPSQFAQKWREETVQNGRLCVHVSTLLDARTIEKLAQYRIIDETEQRLLEGSQKTFSTAYTRFAKTVGPMWRALNNAISGDRQAYERTVTQIEQTYLRNDVHRELREVRENQLSEEADLRLRRDDNQRIAQLERAYRGLLHSLRRSTQGAETPERVGESGRASPFRAQRAVSPQRILHRARSVTHNPLEQCVETAREEWEREKEVVHREYDAIIRTVQDTYARQFRPLFRRLQDIQRIRDHALREAARRYNRTTAPSRQRYLLVTQPARTVYQRALDEISRNYCRHIQAHCE